MKILQVNKFFYRRGGAETHFFDLCNLLEKHGHEVIHFSTQDLQNLPSPYSKFFIKHFEMRGVKGLYKKAKTFSHLLYSTDAAQKIEELIKETRPDIAHLHNIYYHLSPSILPILKKYKIPVVMTLHDYKLACPNYKMFTEGKTCERCKTHKYYNAILHKCIFDEIMPSIGAAVEISFHKLWGVYEKNIDLFISPSNFLKEKMIDWGQKANKITVLQNFVSIKNLPLPPLGNYLLYFGRLTEEKGLLYLVEAMKLLPEKELRIAGTGPLQKKLEQAIQGMNNIKLLGYKEETELQKEILGAKIIVAPSIWYENCPLSVLEAMSYGKIVLASIIGGMTELVKDRQSGFLHAPGNPKSLANAIKSIWNNEEYLKGVAEQAQKQMVENNDPEKYYQNLMKIYKKVLR